MLLFRRRLFVAPGFSAILQRPVSSKNTSIKTDTNKVARVQKSSAQKWRRYPHLFTESSGPKYYSAPVDALFLYKEKFGITHIPRGYAFSASDPSLPAKYRGFPIYAEVNLWRCLMRDKLLHVDSVAVLQEKAPEFEWDVRKAQFLCRMHQMSTWRSIYGELKALPSRWQVPQNDTSWPEPYWGAKLGAAMADMRRPRRPVFRERLADVKTSLGADLSARIKKKNYHGLIAALGAYREKAGAVSSTILIPSDFVVPDSPDWPPLARGVKLGAMVHNMRYKKIYWKHREELQRLGVSYKDEEERDSAAGINRKGRRRRELVLNI